MPEEEVKFSGSMKYTGIFSFRDFYKFCYDWLNEETGLDQFAEEKYEEKIIGEAKDVEIKWVGSKKFTDYFKFEITVKLTIRRLTTVEVMQNNTKVKANSGELKATVKGVLIRDYEQKFERDAFRKFLRSIYEKWIIKSRIDQFEDKVMEECDEFLAQAKAYLDLEGKRGIFKRKHSAVY